MRSEVTGCDGIDPTRETDLKMRNGRFNSNSQSGPLLGWGLPPLMHQGFPQGQGSPTLFRLAVSLLWASWPLNRGLFLRRAIV